MRLGRYLFCVGSAIAFSVCQSSGVIAAGEGAAWSYSGKNGPEHWASLDKEYLKCDAGLQQSPIDISKPIKASLPALKIDWKKENLKIVPDGQSIHAHIDGNSWMTFEGKRYKLVHFHAHAPSEHTIEGRAYPMEIHFVHQNPETQELGVLGVLIDEGGVNQTFSKLTKAKFGVKNTGGNPTLEDVNISALLPGSTEYWAYEGSLTTPPCSEPVTWRLLKQPLKVSSEDLLNLKPIFSGSARPVQKRANRILLESN